MAHLVRTYDYSTFRSLDYFFSHSKSLKGGFIRIACFWDKGLRAAWRRRRDRSVPNHGGIILDIHGQKMIYELTLWGMRPHSFLDYCTEKHHFTDIFRYSGFDSAVKRAEVEAWLQAEIRRGKDRETEYDLSGAALSSPLGRAFYKIFSPRKYRRYMKKLDANPKKDYCTESQKESLEEAEYDGCPPLPKHCNPIVMRNWMARNSQFSKLYGYERPLR